MFTIKIYNPVFFGWNSIVRSLHYRKDFFFFLLCWKRLQRSQSAVSSGCSAGCFIHLSLRQTCTFSTVCAVGLTVVQLWRTQRKNELFEMNIFFQLDPREMYLVMFLNMWNYLLWIVCWISWMFPVKRVTCVFQFDEHLNALFFLKKGIPKRFWYDDRMKQNLFST